MTQLLGLLHEAAGSREDDARLVLADWLEDHGEGARAELIRVQIELTRAEELDERRPALQSRERDILAAHAPTWLAGMDRWCSEWEFRRGFLRLTTWAEALAEVSVPEEVWAWVEELRLLDVSPRALTQLHESPLLASVPAVDFTECGLKLAGLRALVAAPWLANLRSLNLEKNNVGNKGALLLAASPHVANLRSLDLTQNLLGFQSIQAIAASPHLAGLTALNLNDNSGGEAGLVALLTSPQLARLDSLSAIYNCRGTPRGDLGPLTTCPRPASLTRLDFMGNFLSPRGVAALVASPLLAKLTDLDLSINDVKPEAMRALAASPHLANLTSLHLYASRPGDEGARALVGSPYLTRLTHLDLSMNGMAFTVAGVETLAAWPRLAGILRLELNVDAAGAAALARSPHVAGLRYLDLSPGLARDEGAAALAGSPHLNDLRELRMGGNNIGEEGTAALRQHFGERVSFTD